MNPNRRSLIALFVTILLVTVWILAGSAGHAQDRGEAKSWVSSHHSIEIKYGAEWEFFSTRIDRADRVRVLFIDQKDGTSFHVRVEQDHALKAFSEDQYRKTLRDTLIGANESNKIVDERDIQLFSKSWHRIRGSIWNEKWKTRMTVDIVYRQVGKLLALVQWSFPEKPTDAEAVLPAKLSKLVTQSKVFDQTGD